jgi:DNA-binding transcriptional regulator YdaS (Cro superfamily)
MTAAALRELATEEVRRRTFWRGSPKEAAQVLGLSPSYITALSNGTVEMTDKAARTILAAAREEELALADRIEAEINRPSLLKDLG